MQHRTQLCLFEPSTNGFVFNVRIMLSGRCIWASQCWLLSPVSMQHIWPRWLHFANFSDYKTQWPPAGRWQSKSAVLLHIIQTRGRSFSSTSCNTCRSTVITEKRQNEKGGKKRRISYSTGQKKMQKLQLSQHKWYKHPPFYKRESIILHVEVVIASIQFLVTFGQP